MTPQTFKTNSTNHPVRNGDGTLNLAHYRTRAQTERACAIRHFSKIIQSLVSFQR